MSFKERVRKELLVAAKDYKRNFVDVDYLLYSRSFRYQRLYVVSAKEDNFLHLTGVGTDLSAQHFFEKCLDGTLAEEDFEIGDKMQKGSIRRKMSVLPQAMSLFSSYPLYVEEQFQKNRISCSFASTTTAKVCTVGFTKTKLSKPQTVLKGNYLKNPVAVELLLKKESSRQRSYQVVYNSISLEEVELSALLLEWNDW